MRVCVGESGAQFDAEARESMGGEDARLLCGRGLRLGGREICCCFYCVVNQCIVERRKNFCIFFESNACRFRKSDYLCIRNSEITSAQVEGKEEK